MQLFDDLRDFGSFDDAVRALVSKTFSPCSLTGEVLQIGRGSVARLAVVRATGFARDA